MLNKLLNKITDSDSKEIVTKGFVFFVFKMGGTVLSYIFTLYITLNHGADVFGLIAIGLSIFMIAGVVGKLGLDLNIVKYYSHDPNLSDAGIFYKALFKTFIFSSFLALILHSGSDYFVNTIFRDPKPGLIKYLNWLLPAIPFWTITMVSAGVLRAKRLNNFFAFYTNAARFVFTLLLLFMFSWYSDNPIIIVKAHFFGVVALSLVSLIHAGIKLKIFKIKSKENSWGFLRDSFPMMMSDAVLVLMGVMDTFVMGIYESDSNVGIYSVAIKIVTITRFSLQAVNSILAPKIAKNFAEGNVELYKKLILFSAKLNFIISGSFIILILIFNKTLLGFFGQEFVLGSKILILLCIGQIINSFSGPGGMVLQMIGKQVIYQNYVLGALVLNLMLTFILTPSYGGIGAATATVISLAFWNIGCAVYLEKKLKITSYYIPFLKSIKSKV